VRNVPVDIRIVAATNRKLEELVSQDRFRRDLYFRLNVARLHLASLQDRKEDIPALCHQIIGELNRRFGRSVNGLTDEAMSALMRHSWPGNVRELRNLMEAVFVNGPADWINYEDLPPHFQHELGDARSQMENERDLVLSVLSETNWNCTRAAAKLHWSRMTLYRKMAKYRLKK
jgi:transcriptional regulator with PAS, ATPase and Fis domain